MNYRKIFKGISIIAFQIGVNVIGLPDFHYHEILNYKNQLVKK